MRVDRLGVLLVAFALVVCAGLAAFSSHLEPAMAAHVPNMGGGVVGVFSAQWEYIGGWPTTTTLGIVYANGDIDYRRLSWPTAGGTDAQEECR